MTRYASVNGYHVSRRFGWDCHGLPVEYEIDKKLGMLFVWILWLGCCWPVLLSYIDTIAGSNVGNSADDAT